MVDKTKCCACETCVQTCPMGAITIEDGTAKINKDLCVHCGACEGICPTNAIKLD